MFFGGDKTFSFRDFKKDFFLDQTMLRRIQHASEVEKRVGRDYDDSRMYDEDEEDENIISDTSGLTTEGNENMCRRRSMSRVPKRERMSMGRG